MARRSARGVAARRRGAPHRSRQGLARHALGSRAMRATVFRGVGDVRIEDVPDPRIDEPTDAIVRVVHACICGSDLWSFRGDSDKDSGSRLGHEYLGVVEAVGSDVRTVRVGDTVISPFTFSDGT